MEIEAMIIAEAQRLERAAFKRAHALEVARVRVGGDAMTDNNEYAWVSLCRLCGCNYKQPVKRRGSWVVVPHPQENFRSFRVDGALFDAGAFQTRDGWAIKKWDEQAQRTTASEKDWHT